MTWWKRLKKRVRSWIFKRRIRWKLMALRRAKARRKLAPAPRYDEVYWKGKEWLDSL